MKRLGKVEMCKLAVQHFCCFIIGVCGIFWSRKGPKMQFGSFAPRTDSGNPGSPCIHGNKYDSFVATKAIASCSAITIVLSKRTWTKVRSTVIQSVMILMIYCRAATDYFGHRLHSAVDTAVDIKRFRAFSPSGVPRKRIEPIIVRGIDNGILALRQRNQAIRWIKRLNNFVSGNTTRHWSSSKGLLRFSRYYIPLILILSTPAYPQGAHISQSPWVSSRQGNPVAGASIAVCQGLATTAASVTSNVGVFTMASNPVTSGFVQGMTVQVSGFSGADTYFNAGTLANGALTNGLPILSVTPTTVTVSLVHANANATTNGSLVQFGNSVTSCAGLATIYTDASLATTTTNPFLSDSLGNYDASVPAGIYYVQVYGSGVTTTLRQITVPLTPGAVTTLGNINGVLYVGTGLGQYASWQAAHDALPSNGGVVAMASTATPFGPLGTTAVAITKSGTYQLGCAVYTYSGSAAQAISIASANAVTIQGCGNANGQPSGATANKGSQIVVTNTATNGIDANVTPGLVLQNFTVLGPNSGTGKCLVLTGNSAHAYDLNCRAFGSNGVEIDGTRGNSNNVTLDRVTSISNGGWGFNTFGVNGNLITFNHTSGSNNALGNYQTATATNVFLGAHSQTSGTGIGFTFPSGGSNNWGNLYSESGDEATAVAFAASANNNFLFLSSQLAYTNAGTNNSVITNRLQLAGAGVGSPTYSFSSSPTTGFYDLGGGALGFSSGGVASFLYGLNLLREGATGTYGWSSNADPTAAGNDTGLSRPAAGLVAVGTGAQGNRAGKLTSALVSADGGAICTNGELGLSAGWQSTGSATVTAVAGTGQTCSWTITTGTTTAANPTVTDTLTNTLVSAGTICEMNIHGGSHTAAAGEGFTQTALSTTAPIFTFIGTPTAGGTTYFVTRRCGP